VLASSVKKDEEILPRQFRRAVPFQLPFVVLSDAFVWR